MGVYTLISNGQLIVPLNNYHHYFDQEIKQLRQQGFSTLDVTVEAETAEEAIEKYKADYDSGDAQFVSLLAVMSNLM
ncbi:TPA: hypothetical protein ACX6RS_000085 [Photobacterium damselae]|uniref:Uncharacterized protein n=1 Tax=Photobacterium damselae TaxID=38293 RepID=A0A2T3QPM0_PHODM|nr:hypothetical protein [Photobacterium damselae]KAB1178798.1 hypothetical protein F6477_12705 [Photobacterium damselae subsp. damselae]MBF7100037.1 hypothetical protein [Photobacterium damselae]MCG3815445.1 hypothetical protein [Photobacterium damselae]MCG3823191.1 hypothetical protein [Photobacterium damselae]NVH49281.1 hypothetical protein [Photobacterium damselae subsp. damselae]